MTIEQVEKNNTFLIKRVVFLEKELAKRDLEIDRLKKESDSLFEYVHLLEAEVEGEVADDSDEGGGASDACGRQDAAPTDGGASVGDKGADGGREDSASLRIDVSGVKSVSVSCFPHGWGGGPDVADDDGYYCYERYSCDECYRCVDALMGGRQDAAPTETRGAFVGDSASQTSGEASLAPTETGEAFVAYKGFDVDDDGNLSCIGRVYKVGEVATQDGDLLICENGIHFCRKLKDVHRFYRLDDEDVAVCEVEILGDVVDWGDGTKSCTNRLRVLRRLSEDEIFEKVNMGRDNKGLFNTGSCNTGDCNTGSYNDGLCNTGDDNFGFQNTGDNNFGHRNTGSFNIGSRNTGLFNKCDWSNGVFCTEEREIEIFNKPSGMTMREFLRSPYQRALNSAPFGLKKVDFERRGVKVGEDYFLAQSYEEACKAWWYMLPGEEKETIMSMPNFNPVVFEEITGICLGEVDSE